METRNEFASLERQHLWDFACARAPASLCVVLEAPPEEKQLTVTAFDPLKGRGKVLRSIEKDPPAFYVSALPSDGATLAISRTGGGFYGGETEIHIAYSHSQAVPTAKLR
jgi:hypothetical protein